MSYEVINQQLGVYYCNIADLTMDQVSSFLGQWNDGSTIGSLTVFYDNDGKIILNADNKNFESYKKMVLKYLTCTYEEQEKMQEKIIEQNLKQIFQVLDKTLIYREKLSFEESWKPIKRMLGKQYIPGEKELDMTDKIYSEARDAFSARVDIYNYAFIQGKRAERARKKRVQNEVAV